MILNVRFLWSVKMLRMLNDWQKWTKYWGVYLDYMWPLNYFQSTQKELKRDLSKQRDTGGTSERVAACEEYASAPLTDSWVEFDNKQSEDCEKTSYVFKAPLFFEETMEFSPYTKDVEAGSPAICFFFFAVVPWSIQLLEEGLGCHGLQADHVSVSHFPRMELMMWSFWSPKDVKELSGCEVDDAMKGHWKVDVSSATRSPR